MKKTVIVVVIVAILAVGGFACFKLFGNNNENPNVDIDTPVSPVRPVENTDGGLASKVVVESVTVTNKIKNIDIKNEYPAIKSFSNKNFENNINSAIATNLAEYRMEINNIIDDQTPDTKLYKYITTFERFSSGNYLTLVINQDYQTGGIRSNTWKDIYNIDVRKEQIIHLADLFSADVDFQTAIINEITVQSDVEFMGGDGLQRLPANQKFYIKEDKLIIYFDPSEAASANYGALEYEMPFELGEDGLFIVE